MMSNDFQQVSYSQFRNTLKQFGGQKIKSSRFKTVVYDNKNRILAVLKAASIDNRGRSQDAEYFVRYAA